MPCSLVLANGQKCHGNANRTLDVEAWDRFWRLDLCIGHASEMDALMAERAEPQPTGALTESLPQGRGGLNDKGAGQ